MVIAYGVGPDGLKGASPDVQRYGLSVGADLAPAIHEFRRPVQACGRCCHRTFMPRKDGERRTLFEELLRERRTMIFFESPHRLLESLQAAAEVFGAERKASVSRELTKKFEHTERGTLAELAEWAKSDPKGEFVVVIAGAAGVIRDIHTLVEDVLTLVDSGERLKDAVNQIAELSKVAKGELYQLSLDARRDKQ